MKGCWKLLEGLRGGAMRMVDGEEEMERMGEEEMMILGSERRGPYETVTRMASANAVVVFSVSGCCMCHVAKRLLLGLGVGPTVYELDQERGGSEIQAVLSQLLSGSSSATSAAVPVVFVGGRLLGGVEKLMACHISGSLVPLLKQAGALWL